MKRSRQRVDIDLEELRRVLDQARQQPIGEADYLKMKVALDVLAERLTPKRTTEKTRTVAFAIESGRILLTLDADFGNILRFPTAGTPGVIRLKIHPPTEEAIREQISKTLEVLKETPLVGCLAVSHGDVIRIRS